MLQRLFAAVLTQLQMWRSVLPEKLQSFGSYSTTLHLVHDVGYWATDAIPEDSRFYWKSYFRYGDRFRAVPLFIPIYGDAVRARGLLAEHVRAVSPGAPLGMGRHRHPVRHPERDHASARSRFGRASGGCINLFGEHINWAIAPFVVTFGADDPAPGQPRVRERRPSARICRSTPA